MPANKTKAKLPVRSKADAETGLVVSAQQTRFHDLTTGASISCDIDIKDIGLALEGQDLLVGADLKLQEGVHYALIGRNGSGKSTLLRAIAEERIPGIPMNLRCLMLGQNFIESTAEGVPHSDSGEQTVLEHVLQSDTKRENALEEQKALSEALNSEDPIEAVKGVRKLKHKHLEQTLKRAQLIAARRSGARGWDARTQLIEMEKQVADSRDLVDQSADEINSSTIETETKEGVSLLDQIQETLESRDVATSETRAKEILLGLRFTEDKLSKPFASLSGGWRTRCDLACALFQTLDLLLLDEPTNFLDLPSIIWLQNYLADFSSTVVIVTHDRDFTDAVAEELIILREKKLGTFNGNLSEYENDRNAQIKRLTRMKEAQDKKIGHIQKSIENNKGAAKRTGDDKKLKQAKSRQRKLDDRVGMEVSAKGTRFKLNRDLGGYHLTSREAIDIPQNDPMVKMSFPTITADLRFPGALISLEKVSFRYPKTKDMVLNDANLSIHPGDRIGIAGANGSGKSTLIKLVVASDDDTTAPRPTTGTITKHPRLRIGYFSQHSTDELAALSTSKPNLTALQHIMEFVGSELSESDARALLGGMGLPGRVASDVPIASLSGGQRVRLGLAKLVWRPPQLLVLDEVTTHLDADTIVALIGVLKSFQGALLIVTHDRFFMRCVVEGEKVYRKTDDSEDDDDSEDVEDSDDGESERRRIVYRMVKGQPRKLERGMAEYEEIVARRWKKLGS